MRAQYPEAMTIVLQHQFWDLAVGDDAFEVGLSFGGVPERLAVPFEAITAFFDPAVQFGFQFETIEGDAARDPAAAAEIAGRARAFAAPRAGSGQARRAADSGRSRDAQDSRGQARSPAPIMAAAVPKWCGSTGSGRNRIVCVTLRRHAQCAGLEERRPACEVRAALERLFMKTRTETDSASGRSKFRPIIIGARRPSARAAISASARSACRAR